MHPTALVLLVQHQSTQTPLKGGNSSVLTPLRQPFYKQKQLVLMHQCFQDRYKNKYSCFYISIVTESKELEKN